MTAHQFGMFRWKRGCMVICHKVGNFIFFLQNIVLNGVLDICLVQIREKTIWHVSGFYLADLVVYNADSAEFPDWLVLFQAEDMGN